MSEAEVKTIVGTCQEISERNGWTTFAVNVGTQYPVKVSTKVAEVIEQARSVGEQTATWTFKETDGNENPNRPGTFYKNRWLNKVEVGQTAEPTAPTTSGNQPRPTVEAHHKPIHEADKQRVISRLSCLSTAAALYGGGDGPSFTGDLPLLVMKAAARFETWVFRDIDEVPLSSGTEMPQSQGDQVPDDESDIPF